MGSVVRRGFGAGFLSRRAALLLALFLVSCRTAAPPDRARASGYVEAEEIQLAAKVGGRVVELKVGEGARVSVGQVVARLESTDTELALERARADRRQAEAQLRLLQAGPAPEDVRQAEAQIAAAEAEAALARDELAAAERDLERFETLLDSNAGSRKQRDDAATKRDVARQRVRAMDERARAARATLARLRAGARAQEIDAARARVAAAHAAIKSLEQTSRDATVTAPLAGVVTQRLVDPGEIVPPGTPLLAIANLDEVWANVYVEEPVVPRIRLGQEATLRTDAGTALPGKVTFISSKAEFTPRNVQTAEERAKLVYRLKVTVKNEQGVLKQGMPVTAEIPFGQ
ncbi:MAG: HlyD family efflux transporter periplasmic adaptor subunit [Acidobacteria bacterium]|nr:HlyD family efflux transporter periplasmic adaptor subunit [Acidobacteriota bacterium]